MFSRVQATSRAVASVLFAAGLALQACSGDDPVGNPVAPTDPSPQLLVEPSEVTILVGESVQLRVAGASVQSGAGFATEWVSSDPLVAMISPEGVVTGVGLGAVQISATRAGFHATSRVSVYGRKQAGSGPNRRRVQPY